MNGNYQGLFVVGAPKSGTSSLFRWLESHPRVRGTEPKETFALMDSDHPLSHMRQAPQMNGPTELFEFLKNKSANKRGADVILEATPHHYYQQLALQLLPEIKNSVRVIFVIRHPSDRILSSFLYTKNNLARIAEGFSFAQYVDCLLSGDSQRIASYVKNPQSSVVLANELSLSSYSKYLQLWRERLGHERVGCWLAEDLFKQPRQIVQQVCHFADLDADHFHDFDFARQNETRQIGSRSMHRWALFAGNWLPRFRGKASLKKMYYRLQGRASREPRENYDDSLCRLDQYFEPEISRLRQQLHSPLAAWHRTRQPATPHPQS